METLSCVRECTGVPVVRILLASSIGQYDIGMGPERPFKIPVDDEAARAKSTSTSEPYQRVPPDIQPNYRQIEAIRESGIDVAPR